jgi:hypothetical protein
MLTLTVATFHFKLVSMPDGDKLINLLAQAEGAARRGFDIGMGAAEGHRTRSW